MLLLLGLGVPKKLSGFLDLVRGPLPPGGVVGDLGFFNLLLGDRLFLKKSLDGSLALLVGRVWLCWDEVGGGGSRCCFLGMSSRFLGAFLVQGRESLEPGSLFRRRTGILLCCESGTLFRLGAGSGFPLLLVFVVVEGAAAGSAGAAVVIISVLKSNLTEVFVLCLLLLQEGV